MSKIWRYQLAASLCTLALVSACGDDPVTPAPSGDGDTMPGDGDGDGDGGDGDGDGDIDKNPVGTTIEGQYWMRTDLDATITQVEVNATIRSEITAYSLVQISKDGSQYKMVDWQCHVTTKQECESVCSAASSATSEGQAYVPSTRTLTVSGSSWSTSTCAAAVGWKWDCAKDGAVAMPTTASDPLVYNPGGGEVGVDIDATVTAIIPLTCKANVVQKVDVLYSGSLTDGVLQGSGVATDNGSQQNVLGGTCGDVPNPVPVGPGSLRFAKRDIPGGAEPAAWTCPSLSDFQAALPQR